MKISETADWIRENCGELLALRRRIHQNPELGHQEYQTSALIAEQLQACGAELLDGFSTGVAAMIRGSREGCWPCGRISTRCRFRSAPGCRLPPAKTGFPMPAGTMCTPPLFWRAQNFSVGIRTASTAPFSSFSSVRRKPATAL